ncbi:MAG: prepilin-type N-terminal cleavage/methylation domain-containing protein [Candidatus Thiodiazotropha sp.]
MSNHNASILRQHGLVNGGFTLLEVMVALLLLAIIMTTSVSMLFVNLKGWDGLASHSDEILQEHLVQNRVTNMVQHLTPLVWRDPKQRLLAMRGESKQFQFISKSPQQYTPGGLFEYLLIEESSPQQGLSLVLYYAPMDPNASQLYLPENGSRRVLITGLEAVEFAYFGSKQERESVAWHNSWESNSAHYPDLIRLTLRSHGDEGATKESFFKIHRDYPVVVRREQR